MPRSLLLAPVLALLAFLTGAVGASAQDDPASVLQRFQDARNLGDVDGAMALVAPDLSYSGGPACPPASPCIGTAALRRDVQLFIADQVYSSSIVSPDVSGTTVHARLASQSPSRSAIGLERTLSDLTAEVRDGQISSWRSGDDATDPQTAWWLDHQPVPSPELAR